MKPSEAIAELERLFSMPPSRVRVWESLADAEKVAVLKMAGLYGQAPIGAANMRPDEFERCWCIVERFARLAYRIAAANDELPARDLARITELSRAARATA